MFTRQLPSMTREERKSWKAETKFYMANERTMIAWLRIASTLGIGAFLGVRYGRGHFRAEQTPVGLFQLGVAALIVIYAFVMFHRRAWLVRLRHHGTFDENIGPGVVAVMIAGGLILELIRLLREPAVGCVLLPLPLAQNLAPPFLYLTFHGTANIRHGCGAGIGGVHRFSLDGKYAGLAIDQEKGKVQSPRGMTRLDGLFFIADSATEDPSIAVFGPCAGSAARFYLGRIRPDGGHFDAFGHPYGLAADGRELLVSAQNGGAVVTVDPQTSEMRVDKQIEKPRSFRDRKSGPLRGIAIDGEGCMHVADKHANLLWHFCKGEGKTSTQLVKPISLFWDPGANLLYASLLGGGGEVVALDLKNRTGGLRTVARYQHKHMPHPTGMVTRDQKLYVLEQKTKSLLTFDVGTGKYIAHILTDLPDAPEQLLLTDDC